MRCFMSTFGTGRRRRSRRTYSTASTLPSYTNHPNLLLHTHRYLLHPPDEKTNILRCAEYIEKRKAKVRAKRAALGLPDDGTPVPLDDDDEQEEEGGEEEDDEDDEEEEEEEGSLALVEEAQRLLREKHAKSHDPMEEIRQRQV